MHDVGFVRRSEVFVVMECVEGRTLRDELRDRGRFEPDQAAAVLVPVCEALAAAHDRGIVHRDVNPGNVMRCTDGTVKLMDFGIAQVADVEGFTGTGVVMGTAAYLSPEQVRCEALDGRSDVYAVGCTLYELLTGRTPFQGPSSVEVASQRLRESPVPPRQYVRDVSPDLDAVVLRAMALEPAMRHHDARELADDLRRFAAPDPTLRTDVITPWDRGPGCSVRAVGVSRRRGRRTSARRGPGPGRARALVGRAPDRDHPRRARGARARRARGSCCCARLSAGSGRLPDPAQRQPAVGGARRRPRPRGRPSTSARRR